jgi:PAS domain S-box-containing protein
MNNRNERILIIDDNPSIHEDFRKILGGSKSPNLRWLDAKAALFGEPAAPGGEALFELDSAYQGQEGLERVQTALTEGRPYALAFVDVRMPPGWDGVETIGRLWKAYPELQVVICTAYSDYSWEQIIQQLGKSDSLVILKKPFDNVEVLQLAHALTEKWFLSQQAKDRMQDLDRIVRQRTAELQAANQKLQEEIAERRQMEEALRVSQERFAKAFQASPIPMAIQTLREERFVDVNEAFLRRMGYQAGEVIGRTPLELELWAEPSARQQFLSTLHRDHSVRNWECQFRTSAQQLRHVLLSAELFELDAEPNVLVIAEDISERLNLERQLRQAQKMEAVGQLAAGIAHDFNNLLTIIQGHVSLRLTARDLDEKLADSLQQVAVATERAANLTRQLLAFSSKQIMQPKVLNLNQVIRAMHDMLVRIIGEQITLQCECAEDLPAILADEANMEQIVMNLAVNARDAMTNGGQLTLRTREMRIEEEDAAQNPEARPGNFICFTLIDTGCGMDPHVLSHIFEPFYTTKEVGKGTGLGLATVYGIVKQHGGWIEVSSRVSSGSTFRVFLPVTEKSVEPNPGPKPPRFNLRGHERVLIVEDESLLRELVHEILERNGYGVFEAANGVEALEIWAREKGDFDLLVTDLVMPNGISGRDLAQRLRLKEPKLKVLFTSGYSSEMVSQEVALGTDTSFLQKPYKPDFLLEVVRQIIEQPQAVAS